MKFSVPLRAAPTAFAASLIIIVASSALSAPTAPTAIRAPAGWEIERSANGIIVFIPADLNAGETLKVAVFDGTPLGGKPLKEWLQAFAGPVGQEAGNLIRPLKMTQAEDKILAGTGVYVGPNGAALGVTFLAVSLDRSKVHAMRVLYSDQDGLLARYEKAIAAINLSLIEHAKEETRNTRVKITRSSRARRTPGKSREKAPYAWTVPPGKGLKPSQIAGVWQWPEPDPVFGGLKSEVCLMLTDGTLYKGLPVPPDQMDVAGSRRAEPAKWGRWRKSGDKHLVAWAGRTDRFEPLEGGFVKPGKSNQRLNGRWSASRTFGGAGTFSSWHTWGVTFTPDGRFNKDTSGGGASPMLSGLPSANHAYNDAGSQASATGEGYVAASGSRSKPKGDRSGTYTIDGYVLTLRYDNGTVARFPFFFLNSSQQMLWFENSLLWSKRGSS
ncbi:MAG: hypothetical protein H7Z41_20255 [Cytophagales bacterium]|nr:hypothetical protein [Armatimonadota bacterium]